MTVSREIEKLPIFGPEGAAAMTGRTAGVVGLGALGSVSSLLLSRFPLKKLVLVDRDVVEKKNLYRQYLYTEDDAEKVLPKTEAAKRKLEASSRAPIEARDVHLDAERAKELFDECDIVIDATDNFETRFILNDASAFYGKPWIYGGVLGSRGAALFVDPKSGPCLRCVFDEIPSVGAEESCDTAGIHPSLPMIVASVQVAEAAKFLAGRLSAVERSLLHVDLDETRFVKIKPSKQPGCPVCSGSGSSLPDIPEGDEVRELCGGESVLVILRGRKFDLGEIATRLEKEGEVLQNGFLVRIRKEGTGMTIHSDGRVLVNGIGDGRKAMSFVSRMLGL